MAYAWLKHLNVNFKVCISKIGWLRLEKVKFVGIDLYVGMFMSSGVLEEVLKEVRLVREKVERLEEIVEERLIGVEEPLGDEVKAINAYMKAKEKRRVEFVPLENFEKKGK